VQGQGCSRIPRRDQHPAFGFTARLRVSKSQAASGMFPDDYEADCCGWGMTRSVGVSGRELALLEPLVPSSRIVSVVCFITTAAWWKA
jgi:hypothetical protein